MMTHSHILVGAVLFARPGAPFAAAAAIAGSLAPDLDVAMMWVTERIGGASSCVIFRQRFWESPWVEVQAIFNSAPLWALLALLGWLARDRIGAALFAFGCAGLLHVAADFALHADDARAHLQPFADWRFHSPVSYWDPAYYGREVQIAEAVFALTLILVLWRRFGGWRARAPLALAGALSALILYGAATSQGERHDHGAACEAKAGVGASAEAAA